MMRSVTWVVLLLFSGIATAEIRRYALVIGANSGDRNEVVLRYAESDAQRMGHIFRTVGGFHPEDVLVLNDVSSTEAQRVLISLNERIRQNSTESVESLLLVFYSGHADADALHLSGSRLPMAVLRGLVSGSSATARVLVIDACRSGAVTRIKGGRPGPSFNVRLETPLGAQGFAILTSSAAGEDSQESDQLGASFFTHYLSSGLIGAADRNKDGHVTLGEAFSYASERTLAATATTVAGPQHPTYRMEIGGRNDLVLTQPGSLSHKLGSLGFPKPGWYLIYSKTGAIVAELQTDEIGHKLTLEAGQYQITRRGADHLLQGDFQIRPGTITHINLDAMRRIDYARVVRKGGTAKTSVPSAFVVGGFRSEMLGLGTAWRTEMGARVDFSTLSLEVRLELSGSNHSNPHLNIQSYELTPALVGIRAFDIGPIIVGLGIEVGGSWIFQQFKSETTPDRNSLGLMFGPIAQIQIPFFRRFYLRIDNSATIYVLPTGKEPNNEAIGTHAVFRSCGGFGMYF